MTTVYFVRHAQPNYDNHDDLTRELTEKGLQDRLKVVEALGDAPIRAVLSSPYKRAIDTVQPLAHRLGLPVETDVDFRERKVGDGWLEDFTSFAKRQWADFDFALEHGESLRQVQARNAAALERALERYDGKTIVIGSHGTALSSLVEHYTPGFGYKGFDRIRNIMPWVVRFTFDGSNCIAVDEISL
jgi:2,3-bisphosphoglycerate-dependent phosphoglycerate mutase